MRSVELIKKKNVDGCNEKETLEIALTNLEEEVS